MRLKSIEIENITSLMGKHYIDFEDILKEGELFAITGPTGSGKSSILTSISLALYGKNYKKNLDSKDFVSLGSASSKVNLHFETKGELYCASWSLKVLKKNGDPIKKPSPQRIVTKEGVAVEETPEEIIGLTFDQFVRSVVLNQGQFSKFITSNFSERRKILERLYSENELAEINKKLREKLSQEKQEIEKLSIKLDSSLPYTEIEISEAEEELPRLQINLEKSKTDYKSLSELQTQLKDIIEFSNKRLQFLKKSNEIQIDLEKANKNVNDQSEIITVKNEEFDQFKIQYNEESEQLKKAIKVRANLEGLEDKLTALTNSIKKTKDKLKELKSEDTEKENELNSLKNIKDDLQLATEITDLKLHEIENAQEIISSLKSIDHTRSHLIEGIEKKNKEIVKIEKNGKELSSKINEEEKNLIEIFNNNDFEGSYKHSVDIIDTRLIEVNKLILISDQADERVKILSKKIDQLTNKSLDKKIVNSQSKIQKLNKEYEQAKEKESTYKKNELLLSLVKESIENKTCKVCTQPIQTSLLVDIKNDLTKDLEDNKGLIDLEQISDLISIENETLTIFKQQEKTTKKEINELEQEINELLKSVTDKKSLTEEYKDLSNEKENLYKKYQKAREISDGLTINKQKLISLRGQFSDIKEEIATHQRKLDTSNKEEQKEKSSLIKLIKSEESIEDLQSIENKLKKSKELLRVIESIANIEAAKLSISKQLKDLTIEQEQAELDKTKFSFEKKDITKELEELTKGLNIDTALKDLNKKRDSLESELSEAVKLRSKLETEYTRLLTSIESLKDQILSLENSTISALGNISKINIKEIQLTSKNKETGIFLDKVKSIKSPPTNEESIEGLADGFERLLRKELELHEEEISAISATITRYQEKISLYRSKESEQKKDKELLQKLKSSMERLNSLADVLGKNKDEFRNFVLGFIEQQLIQNTNHELSKICDGRYGLTQKESTHGHDFFITDRWNGAMERKVTTLSGGETFLVSLAMALSLAEMTRGQVDIDCFFIDEGFGSLDADSIEDAFNALMSVRSRGKQIGIISHVKELTSRIPANINLNKSAEGQSKIEYIYN